MYMNSETRRCVGSPDLLERLRLRIGGLHSDQGGQSIVYMVMVMFLLACFTFMVINSGALLHDKMQAQSAADSAVLSGSTWMARGMNLNSMMNIFMTMLLAEEMYMKAVLWTATTAVIISPTIEAFWLGVCYTTAVCSPSLEVPFDTFELFPILFEAQDNEDFIWDVMETLSNVEEGVHEGMIVAAELEAVEIARGLVNEPANVVNPVRMAEEVATLDNICHGRLDLGVGRSGFTRVYESYDVPYDESRQRFLEYLNVMRLAWSQEQFSYEGDVYSFNEVCVIPKTFQKPYPPLWSAATTRESFPLYGEMGLNILVGLRGMTVPVTFEDNPLQDERAVN